MSAARSKTRGHVYVYGLTNDVFAYGHSEDFPSSDDLKSGGCAVVRGRANSKNRNFLLTSFANTFLEKTASHLGRYINTINFQVARRHRQPFSLFLDTLRGRQRTDGLPEGRS